MKKIVAIYLPGLVTTSPGYGILNMLRMSRLPERGSL
jgi:hypothetical protein